MHLLEYFDFCSLSIDLHDYSEIFCNGTYNYTAKSLILLAGKIS